MHRTYRSVLLTLAVHAGLLCGLAAANEGQDDLDKATRAKVNAKTLSDLSEVIRLVESALAQGLDEENTHFAKTLLASTLSQRGIETSKTIFESLPPDPRWPQFRRVALEDLEKAVKLDPSQAEAHWRIAQLNLLPEGDAKAAAKALDLAIRHSKEEPALRVRALMLRAGLEKDVKKKLADLNEAARIVPGNVAVLRARGELYSQSEKFPQALADLDAALKIEPKHAPTLEAKAMVLGKMKKSEEALALIDQVQELDPKSISPLVHRARIHAMKPDLPAALKDLDEACRREPGNVAVLLLRASVHQEMKENEKALADVEKVLALRPDFDVAMRFRAALLAGEGKFRDAIAQVEELLKTRPENPDAQLQLALLFTANQMYDKAVKVYSELIKKDPGNWTALRGRGDAFLSLGKHAEAIADYEKAYKIEPHDPGLLNNFAWVLCTSPVDKLRNGKRALEIAKEACRLTDYKQAHILSTLGAAYAETGDLKSAMEWSKKAIALGKEEQKADLTKELETYKAGKPIRELKSGEEAKPEADKSKKDSKKPADKPKKEAKKPADK